jgi:Skp family chaperone for outer membrane proteins
MQQLKVELPPMPELPDLPKSNPPPAAVMGVIGVPDVMHASLAAQQVEKVIGERRDKLNEDAQKEQSVWRDMQQALANERSKLSAEQIGARERELQTRVTTAQRQFRDRNRIIQEAAQYALAQIERTLIAVIRQVAEARGMNLVLHRTDVALNINELDITEEVTTQLNKVLPTVVIPPDGVSPVALAKQQSEKQQSEKQAEKPGAAPAAEAAAPAASSAPAAQAPKAK